MNVVESHEADEDQVDRNNIIQQARHDEDQYAGNERNKRRHMGNGQRHGNLLGVGRPDDDNDCACGRFQGAFEPGAGLKPASPIAVAAFSGTGWKGSRRREVDVPRLVLRFADLLCYHCCSLRARQCNRRVEPNMNFTIGIGGAADIDERAASADCVENDPTRTREPRVDAVHSACPKTLYTPTLVGVALGSGRSS